MPYHLQLTTPQRTAMLRVLENQIDMYNDMLTDPMWMNPNAIRELATKSDEEIRKTVAAQAKEVNNNVDILLEISIVHNELKVME